MEKADRTKIPVLIVDDNNQYAKVLEKILKVTFGYFDITMVDNTSEALEMISTDPAKFELLFVDYNFPIGDSGGILLEKLKSHNLLKDKIAFLMTADPTSENVSQALEAGALGVVAKPFNSKQLKEQIEKADKSKGFVEKEEF